jgi:hypothetical protein
VAAVRYRFYDLILESDRDLPDLARVEAEDETPPSITIQSTRARFEDPEAVWFNEWRLPDGGLWLAAARRPGGGYLLRAPDLAEFEIAAAGGVVRVRSKSATSAVMLRHLLLDQVLPLLVSYRGELVLHASAASLGGGAAVLVARGGSGKSTLAAALGVRGATVVGDDAVALRASRTGLVALGSYPGLRLWPDACGLAGIKAGSSSRKRRVGPDESGLSFERAPVPVAAIYLLEPSQGPIRIEPVPPRDAVMTLVANTYTLDIGDREWLARQLDRAIDSGHAVPIRRVVYPHDASRIDDLCSALAADVSCSA